MSELYIINTFAPKYREAIFSEIDRTWDCHWYFGENDTDIKGMPKGILKKEKYVKTRNIFRSLKWQKGTTGLIRKKDCTQMLVLGEPKILSTWWILLQKKLFFPKKKIYLWTHGWYGRENFAKKWLKRMYFGMADHILTYGDYARRQAIQQGFKSHKITPIHNSLDYENQKRIRKNLDISNVYHVHFGNENPTLLFVGRLTREKRIDLLIEAINILDHDNSPVNLILIGDGTETGSLKKLVDKYGLKDRVWFYGACYDDSEIASLIYNASLCISPGNVGLTAMHSMAFGTPVVTHNCFPYQGPEFEAIIPGKTGAFFKHNDVDSLVTEVRKWLNHNPTERESTRKFCYEVVEKEWSVDFQMARFKEIIK